MKPTDTLRELAKIAKSKSNMRLVWIYFRNMVMHRRKMTTVAPVAIEQNFDLIPWE